MTICSVCTEKQDTCNLRYVHKSDLTTWYGCAGVLQYLFSVSMHLMILSLNTLLAASLIFTLKIRYALGKYGTFTIFDLRTFKLRSEITAFLAYHKSHQ